ncbi:hypothetical protein SK3146_06120 [Paenibacillus konkukensis]|uniref:Uncharacterized protein n=1 Tax=Paenibacillus konkukensis TaxID=2020716 RepID=A0ABY4RZQ0_9BACL|nr:hypothetical protein [Paenibacillus konkukensis]UQZ86827.1 hypothetical protein SK3146_06120 [Paenibacillus konkukensis]
MKARRIAAAVIVLLFIAAAFLEEYKASFPRVSDAVAFDKDVSESLRVQGQELIPVYEIGSEAFYFGVNKELALVGIHAVKGLFGWKVKSRTTGTGFGLKEPWQKPLRGGSNENNIVFFGLADATAADAVLVNGERAAMVRLDAYLDRPEAKGLAVWYVKLKEKADRPVIEAVDREGNVVYKL